MSVIKRPDRRRRGTAMRLARAWIFPGLVALLHSAIALALPDSNTIEFQTCNLELPGTNRLASARCGWFEVAENPAEPEGRQIRLRVAVVPAAAREAEDDPVFLFAGGPGQAATEGYVVLQHVFRDIRKNRDIVLIDQRGTGASNPLDCVSPEPESLDTGINLDEVRAMALACLDDLDADPRYYTTTIAMQDYDKVRAAMGYPRINTLGISYGTRTAQVYLRLFPERVRSMIIDGVVPMSLALGSEHGRMLDRAIKAIFDDCAALEDCRERYPSGTGELEELVATLREEPRQIEYIHPMTGAVEDLEFSADVLGFALRFLSYQTETQATVPLLVHEAVSTNTLSRLASQAVLVMQGLSDQISSGMERSVICSEDWPVMPDTSPEANTVLGTLLIDVLGTQCEVWPTIAAPENFHDPVSSDIPVLLLSGARDPVTPPEYATQASAFYSNHLNIIAPGLGHAVISNPCIRRIATDFISTGSTENLDTECVDRIRPAPFFTNLLGPPP